MRSQSDSLRYCKYKIKAIANDSNDLKDLHGVSNCKTTPNCAISLKQVGTSTPPSCIQRKLRFSLKNGKSPPVLEEIIEEHSTKEAKTDVINKG